jgi:hypothetical protein
MTLAIILSLGFTSARAMHTPASWAAQAQINSAIADARTSALYSKMCIIEKSGEIEGISWSVIASRKELGVTLIQVTCSDSAIEKTYQDKAAHGLL